MNTITYTIPGISCGHCTRTIEIELIDLQGVESVEGSVENKTVTVQFDAPATDEKIRALLTEINYPATS
jgi:copper chaperone CopZ